MEQEVTLSDGSVLLLPADMSDEEVRVKAKNAEDKIAAAQPAEKPDYQKVIDWGKSYGDQPDRPDAPPVEVDEPGWDWLRDNAPGLFYTGHELGTGIAEGVGDLPNIVPNTVNTAKSLNDLWRGSGTGKVAPEDQWQPWMKDSIYDKTLEELNPQTPGYENTRRVGRKVGTALPAAPFAAFGPAAAAGTALTSIFAGPAVSEVGKYTGRGIDKLTGNENQRMEQTLETVAPVVTGLARGYKGLPSALKPTNLGPVMSAAVGSTLGTSLGPWGTLAAIPAYIGAGLANKGLIGKSSGVLPNLARTAGETAIPLAQDPNRRGPR